MPDHAKNFVLSCQRNSIVQTSTQGFIENTCASPDLLPYLLATKRCRGTAANYCKNRLQGFSDRVHFYTKVLQGGFAQEVQRSLGGKDYRTGYSSIQNFPMNERPRSFRFETVTSILNIPISILPLHSRQGRTMHKLFSFSPKYRFLGLHKLK